FFSSRRRHTRFSRELEFRRVLFRSPPPYLKDDVMKKILLPTLLLSLMATGAHASSIAEKKAIRSADADVAAAAEKTQAACGNSRSEERRVGKECRSRGSPGHEKKKG